MQVSEMMTPSVDVLGPDTHLQEVARHMRDHDIGALPVARDDRLVGVVTDRDIVVRCLAQMPDLKGATAANAMSEEVLYCFDDQDIDETAFQCAMNGLELFRSIGNKNFMADQFKLV